MAKAMAIVTGSCRRIEDGLEALRRMGIVDPSSIVVEHLDEVEMSGEMVRIPATRITAEVKRLCCCDRPSVVQPCGPCRCDEHKKCAEVSS